MQSNQYPQCPSHRTFTFGPIVIDSNFDSGNCCNVEQNSLTNFDIWIGTDHRKNNYRGWFHFSFKGHGKGTTVKFNIKNMQNQSMLLLEGLVPVYRDQNSKEWKRIRQKVDTSAINWIEWSFKHTMTSNNKVYLAFFYPWSNEDNHKFLTKIQQKCEQDSQIYFYRAPIIKSIEGRPVQFLTISSIAQKLNQQENLEDEELFKGCKKPLMFESGKKGVVIGARVHPGEVPGSHVMTGIIDELTSDSEFAKILRDTFVFYIFPIFNPDGVGRGHYRVDTNGMNLNRCYLNPSPKNHPSIYAVKKVIMHLHSQDKFFAFIDLHAHPSRKGTFIYGNFAQELSKQVDACIFPKILSMNSTDFEYQGSNFTSQQMNSKDKSDHMSKEGSGRVAIFRATKNAHCWTVQCNYNMSRVQNILQNRKKFQQQPIRPTQETLNSKIIIDYRYPPQKQAYDFFTIETYHKLGRQICESLLDLVEKNPYSRVQNPNNHFQSLQNLRMNLAIALLRTESTRFQSPYKKIYNTIINTGNSEELDRAMRALYFLLIKNAKIQNIGGFLKDGDMKFVTLPNSKTPSPVKSFRSKQFNKSSVIRMKKKTFCKEISQGNRQTISPINFNEENLIDIKLDFDSCKDLQNFNDDSRISNLLIDKLRNLQKHSLEKKITLKLQQFRMIGLNNLRHSMFSNNSKNSSKSTEKQSILRNKSKKMEELPIICMVPKKNSLGFMKANNGKIIRKGTKEQFFELH